MKVWITKYALSRGIVETEAKRICADTVSVENGSTVCGWYGRDDWHITRNAAVVRAEEMRKKKITSLRKQITRLEGMKFE